MNVKYGIYSSHGLCVSWLWLYWLLNLPSSSCSSCHFHRPSFPFPPFHCAHQLPTHAVSLPPHLHPSPVLSFVLSKSSLEGRPFPDGALHAATGSHHADQRQRVGRGRLLLPALHGLHAPPGGDTLRPGSARDTHGGGEAGGCGGRRGGTHLCVTAQQACRHPAMDA